MLSVVFDSWKHVVDACLGCFGEHVAKGGASGGQPSFGFLHNRAPLILFEQFQILNGRFENIVALTEEGLKVLRALQFPVTSHQSQKVLHFPNPLLDEV